ncbi:MAG: glycosyltransferase [Prevotella sp.]|nr:glycosyltransferase [Prevotella sp.]
MLKRVGASDDLQAEKVPSEPMTVLIVAGHDQSQALERNLPHWLGQQYGENFEVVVVAEKGDGDTEDVLKRFAQSPNLYATYVPQSSRYMSRQKLAITLGVKAAKNEWIVLTDATAKPSSESWLATVAAHCSEDKNLVAVYGNYDEQARPFCRFETLYTSSYLLRCAMKKTAYRSNTTTCVFRKSDFIRQDGYRGNLEFVRGEYDFLVNKYAEKHRTAVVLDPSARIINDEPTAKELHNKHIFYMHTHKFLKRSRLPRFLFNTDQFLLHLTTLLQLLTVVAGALLLVLGEKTVENTVFGAVLVASGILSFVLSAVLRTVFAKPVVRFFDANVALWRVFPYEWSLIWRNLGRFWAYARAEKSDFSTHKV